MYKEFLFIYWIVLSILGFFSMGIDKWKAKKHKYRISEKALLTIAIFGGSIGSILGMKVFHHKTLHNKFRIGLPLILLCQLILLFLLVTVL